MAPAAAAGVHARALWGIASGGVGTSDIPPRLPDHLSSESLSTSKPPESPNITRASSSFPSALNCQLRTPPRTFQFNNPQISILTLCRIMSAAPHFWSTPFRYCRWAARERPAYFWSVFIGGIGPVFVGPVRWLRFRMGDETPAQIPQTYPSTLDPIQGIDSVRSKKLTRR